MNVSCENCGTTYRIDESKIPPQGVKAKCPKCSHSFVLHPPGGGAEPFGSPPPDPFGGQAADPFGSGSTGGDPFSGGGGAGGDDPFASSGGAQSAPAGGGDPFGGAASDPFSSGTGAAGGNGGAPPPSGGDPFASPGQDDPFGADPFAGGGGQESDSLFGEKTEFRIQRASGETIGPFDLFTLKQMIYEQKLDGSEQIEDIAGGFEPIMNNEELAEIFRLLGKQQPAGGAAPADPGMGAASPSPAPMGGDDPFGSGASSAPMNDAPSMAPMDSAPSFDIDRADSGAKKKLLIGVERAWETIKQPGVLLVLAIVVVVGGLAAFGYTQREAISSMLGLTQAREAQTVRAAAEVSLYADTRAQVDDARQNLERALALVPDDEMTMARKAEVDAILWARDPERVGAKTEAEKLIAQIASSNKEDVKAGALRASARMALGAGDLATAKAKTEELAALAPGDAMLPFLQGEIALMSGDSAAAQAAFDAASKVTIAAASEGEEPQAVGRAAAWYGRARAMALADEWDPALKAATQAKTLDPTHGGARALVAFAKAREGGEGAEEARRELLKVAEDPTLFAADRSRAHYYLGVIAEDAGQVEPALYRYRRAVALDPRDAEAKASARRLFRTRFPKRDAEEWIGHVAVVRGSMAFKQVALAEQSKGTGAALLALEKARQQDGNSPRVHLALGQLYAKDVTTLDKAAEHLDRAIQLDGTYAEALAARASLHIQQKEDEKALDLARKAVAIDPTIVAAHLVAGEASLATDKPQAAITYFKVALQFNPDLAAGWMGLGRAEVESGNAAASIEPLMRAAQLAPESVTPLIELGRAYEALGDLENATKTYDKALVLDSENANLKARVGVLLVKSGKYVEGKKALRRVVDTQDKNAEAIFYLGQAYEFTNDFTSAEIEYKRVAELEPKNHRAYYHLGVITFAQGQYNDAKDYFAQALDAKPDYYQAHEKLADLYIENLEVEKGLAELRKVENIVKKRPAAERKQVLIRVYLVSARAFRDGPKKNPKKARGYYQRVLRLDPRNADAHYGIGLMSVETNPQAAMKSFSNAIRFDPQFALPYRDLGYLQKQFNNCKAAKRSFQEYVKRAPEARDKRSIEDEIAYLQAECG